MRRVDGIFYQRQLRRPDRRKAFAKILNFSTNILRRLGTTGVPVFYKILFSCFKKSLLLQATHHLATKCTNSRVRPWISSARQRKLLSFIKKKKTLFVGVFFFENKSQTLNRYDQTNVCLRLGNTENCPSWKYFEIMKGELDKRRDYFQNCHN